MSIWSMKAGRRLLELIGFSGGVRYFLCGGLACAHVKQLLIYTTRKSMKPKKIVLLSGEFKYCFFYFQVSFHFTVLKKVQ